MAPNEEEDLITLSWSGVNVVAKPVGEGGRAWLRKGCSRTSYYSFSSTPDSVHILKNVTGVCRPGELLAIMGASGAGKTTLLNVLTHRNNNKLRVTGDLFVNGSLFDPSSLTSRSAYVQQDDLFIDYITVREQLSFQAALRMDPHLSQEERVAKVNQVIMDLGLTPCEHTRIGTSGQGRNLSGGEMKRLSIACEVLTNPSLLFCDEPTSGLDSFMAQNVVSMMKNMAERGKTIISTIHQPSSDVYAMFDRVLLMAEGRVAFLGTPDEALKFFGKMGLVCPEQHNPADYFINILSLEPGNEATCRWQIQRLCDTFGESDAVFTMLKDVAINQKAPAQQHADIIFGPAKIRSPYRSSWMTQFQWVLWRAWLEATRAPAYLYVRTFQVAMTALFLGLMYRQTGRDGMDVTSINGALFTLVCNMSFSNTSMVINTFCSQKELFRREHHNGMYRADVYFLAKNLVDIPFFTFYPIMYVCIVYFLDGLIADVNHFLMCMLTAVLLTLCAVSFGYLISCVCPNVNVALVVVSPCLLMFFVLSGFLLNLSSIPVIMKGLHYLSWFSYGYEALMINQWQSVTNITCTATSSVCYPDGATILQRNNFSVDNFGSSLATIIYLIVGYRCTAFLFFILTAHRSKTRR